MTVKKAAIILYCIFYFIVASGFTISLHYCGGKIKGISLNSTVNEEGCCGTKKKSKGCCKDKSTFVKVKDNHFAGNAVKVQYNPVKTISDPVFNKLLEVQNPNIVYTLLDYHAPPVLYDNPIYLKHQVLII